MFEVTVYVHHQLPYVYCYIWTIFFIQPPEGVLRYDARDLDQVDSCAVGGIEETLADSACCSPAHVFHSAAQSPTHTASDFEDARSEPPLSSPEVMSTLPVEALLVGSMPPPPPPPPPMANNNSKPHPLQSQDCWRHTVEISFAQPLASRVRLLRHGVTAARGAAVRPPPSLSPGGGRNDARRERPVPVDPAGRGSAAAC